MLLSPLILVRCTHTQILSDRQGFGNLCGYMGKGWKGRGQGMECLTPHKPLPLSEGKGIPSLLPMMFVGVCHITNVLSTNKAFCSQQPQPPHCVTTITNHHHLWQPSFNHLPPPLHTPMTTTGWQCHITGPIHMPLDDYGEGDLARQQPCHIVYMVMMLVVVPVHVTQGEQPDTPPPPLFTQEVGATLPTVMWQLTTDEGWQTAVNEVSHPTGLPLSFFQQVPCWPLPTEQQCGMTMTWWGHDNPSDHNDDTRNFTSQLLLPCQLTCALHSWGINVTLGCTLHGFLTCETPCTPLPVPADYPDPCRGYRFLEGMGIGHRKVTWGLPVLITTNSLY